MDSHLGLMQRVLCGLLRFYQLAISPLKPRCCRFEPTCSEYAIQAVRLHGALKGLWLATCRIMRCHPFYKGPLYDPVPPPKTKYPLAAPPTHTSHNNPK